MKNLKKEEVSKNDTDVWTSDDVKTRDIWDLENVVSAPDEDDNRWILSEFQAINPDSNAFQNYERELQDYQIQLQECV